MGAGPAYLFLGHLLLAAPGPHFPPHWRTMCLLPEAESLSRLPALPEPYLLLPTYPPAPQPVGSATTHSPFDASDIPCSRHPMSVPAWIWAPIAPGLSVQKPDAHRTASQAPTSCLACPLPSHPPGSSCSLPVVLLAEGLLGLGELFPPWPLLSVLHQLPSKYPWGLVREGFLFTFFPGEIIPPLVTWISAFSILGS